MLAEEDGFGAAVLEADHGVFPISDVVAEAEPQDLVAVVVAVEEEVEGVEDVGTFRDEDEDGRGGGATATGVVGWMVLYAAGRSGLVGEGCGLVLFADKPGRAGGDVGVGCEEDITTAALIVFVQKIKI